MGLKEFYSSINMDLLKAKAFYFFFIGAMGTLGPYLFLYYKHTLLLSPKQTIILFTVRSLCLLVASPLLGTIADKLNRFRNILLICLAGYLVTYAAVALVDPIEGFNCKSREHADQIMARLDKLANVPVISKNQTIKPVSTTTVRPRVNQAGDVLDDSYNFETKASNSEKMDFHFFQRELDDSLEKSRNLKNQHPDVRSILHSDGRKRRNARQLSMDENYYHGGFLEDSLYSWPFSKSEYKVTGYLTRPLFITILIITLLGELIASPANTFADVYTLQTLGPEQSHEYGNQIITGVIGQGIMSGILISLTHFKFMEEEAPCLKGSVLNDKPFFYAFFVCIAASLSIASFFHFHRYKEHIDENGKGKFKKVFKCKVFEAIGPLLSNTSHATFLFVILICGVGDGVKSAFLYTYLNELGGEHKHLLPVVTGVHIASHIVFLTLSSMLLRKFGHVKIIYAGLLTYALSFVLYSIIDNAWLVLIAEPFDGLARQLTRVAIITYVGSPPEVGAALQGSTHGIYIGLGISIGGFLFGLLVFKFGYVSVFISLGMSFLLIFALYLGVNHFSDPSTTVAETFTEYFSVPEGDIESDYEIVDVADRKSLLTKE